MDTTVSAVNWHEHLILNGFERISHWQGDYSRHWFLHDDDFVVSLTKGLLGHRLEFMRIVNNKESLSVSGFVTRDNWEEALSFISAINDVTLFPLFIGSEWGGKLVEAYLKDH